jgi:hypothetical protein
LSVPAEFIVYGDGLDYIAVLILCLLCFTLLPF